MADLSAFDGAEFFEDTTFVDVEAERGTVAGKELYRCVLRNCRLADVRFERCAFEACTFDGCDLTNWRPVRSAFNGVVLRDCKLVGAHLVGLAENPDVTFERCLMRYAQLTDLNLRGLTFHACELQEAAFADCSLVDTDFVRCELGGATFSRCDLTNADFSTSRGVFLEPRGNTLKGAYVPMDSAVMLAHAAGLRVEGYDDAPKRKKR